MDRVLALVGLIACSRAGDAPMKPPSPGVADERCLPVLFCNECPDPCTSGRREGTGYRVNEMPATVRSFCVGTTCTDVFDLHRPCKDICRPPTTIDTTCHFDAHRACTSTQAPSP